MVPPETRRRKRQNKLEAEKTKPPEVQIQITLKYDCEWAECYYGSTDAVDFLGHVESHEPHVEIRGTSTKSEKWISCLWNGCGFSSQNVGIVKFHMNFHAFHVRVKEQGRLLLAQNPHLQCRFENTSRNLLPPLSTDRRCQWRTCDFNTNSFQRLLDHVNTHVTGQPRRWNHQKVFCEWGKCGRINKDMSKLKSHVKRHTQEKAVACPVCGVLFVSRVKLVDHCIRQTQDKMYKCSYCKKNYASERLLQEHIRMHVNVYKCPMCDMTCPFRKSLNNHIRTRHLGAKPFKCTFCDHSSANERELKFHMQTHCEEDPYVCEEPNCEFTCRSKNGLHSHHVKVHGHPMDEYACHLCEARYKRGSLLTVHLKNKHGLRWASGTSRFRYIKDDDGVHRLQTLRYDSVYTKEPSEENIPRFKRNQTFTCIAEAPNKFTIVANDDSNMDSEEDADDPEDMEEIDEEGEEEEVEDSDCSRFALPQHQFDSERDSDSEFGGRFALPPNQQESERDSDSEFGGFFSLPPNQHDSEKDTDSERFALQTSYTTPNQQSSERNTDSEFDTRFALATQSPANQQDSDYEFGECLRRYLGLQAGSIHVTKN